MTHNHFNHQKHQLFLSPKFSVQGADNLAWGISWCMPKWSAGISKRDHFLIWKKLQEKKENPYFNLNYKENLWVFLGFFLESFSKNISLQKSKQLQKDSDPIFNQVKGPPNLQTLQKQTKPFNSPTNQISHKKTWENHQKPEEHQPKPSEKPPKSLGKPPKIPRKTTKTTKKP